ncbi:hypothetical protein BIFANG_03205 [Bifidobacterium angulatum DSM 20098 = JCM 7096]|uniref:Uncharacterized protein n=1 Tax=Bifidobacterium angulatum DSM 20098 = JCM 7096 TaxID=518635 RepID=C4FFU0_9BIFI|nr:hypothetical protein BIFANG_03205 [Bifidobacterium angulatum DSM 20098 = JCM 7096]BAQ96692.1 hypothetical protein BBAG_1070 [Bifidobacterium angulatum DSM 20098 = JCM 7096]
MLTFLRALPRWASGRRLFTCRRPCHPKCIIVPPPMPPEDRRTGECRTPSPA